MAKRFTATEKWDDSWFHSLLPKHKLLWLYMLDRCDNAGIFEMNLLLASFHIGQNVTTEEFAKVFGSKVIPVNGSKVWISKFIEFQYRCRASELNSQNKAHSSVLQILKRFGVQYDDVEAPSKPLPSPFEGAKDKDKDTDKDKDKDIKAKSEKIQFAEDVKMTAEEHDKLISKIGKERTAKAIETLSNYKGSSGKRYKSDYKAILSWVLNRVEEDERRSSGTTRTPGQPSSQQQRATFKHGEAEIERLRNVQATIEQRIKDGNQRA